MTMSRHTMLEFEPPLLGCVVGNRDYSFDILHMHKECAVDIPTVRLENKVVGVGNCSGRKFDKFGKFGVSPAAPLLSGHRSSTSAAQIRHAGSPMQKQLRTLHRQGMGMFAVDCMMIRLPFKRK